MLLAAALSVGLALAGVFTGIAAADIPGRGILPDNRGWELVTPPDRGGLDVTALQGVAAVAGGAVTYTSNAAFSDPEGSSGIVRYISRRGSSGWSTRNITPPLDTLAFQTALTQQNLYFGFSTDLSKGVAQVPFKALTADSPVAVNLFRRDTSSNSYDLLSGAQPRDPLGFPAYFAGGSADFSHLVFESDLALTPDAGPSHNVYEWHDGGLKLVNILPDGTVPQEPSQAGSGATKSSAQRNFISADGSRIYFMADVAFTLTDGHLYLRMGGSTTIDVSRSEASSPDPEPKPVAFAGATPDGSKALFLSNEQLVDADTDTRRDLYQFDAHAPQGSRLRLLSRDAEPADGVVGRDGFVGVVGVVGQSDDGATVYFVATDQLVAGAPTDGSPADRVRRLFRWHDGTLTHVARLANGDGDYPAWAFQTDDVHDSGVRTSATTPSGSQLAFFSTQQLTSYPNAGMRELYLYDAATNHIVCASCSPTGAAPTGPAGVRVAERFGPFGDGGPLLAPRLQSSDGSRLFFTTTDALVSQDINGKQDVYEWEHGAAHLISGGTTADNATLLDISASDDEVFFTTRQRLVGFDRDNSVDVYVAKVDGGFADPPPPAPACVGDACQGQPASSALSIAASVNFGGLGNLAPGSPTSARSRVTVSKPKVIVGSRAALRVKVSGRGALTATGAAVKKTSRNVARSGSYTIRVSLTARARRTLAKRRSLRTTVRIVFTSTGGASATANVPLTFRAASARTGR